jgi:hypothetical protein
MAGDVERFIFDHGLNDKVILAGHSMYLARNSALQTKTQGCKSRLILDFDETESSKSSHINGECTNIKSFVTNI